MDKVYETMVCKILVIRQQRTVTPGRCKTNKGSPGVVPTYCLERVARLHCREQDPGGAGQVLRAEDIESEYRGTRMAKGHPQNA